MVTEVEVRCIGCGCTDSRACDGGCYWEWVEPEDGEGLCSRCAGDPFKGDPRCGDDSCGATAAVVQVAERISR